MSSISVTRAAHVIEFVELLRELGAPVERELARAKLPTFIEDIPDGFVSNLFAMDFVRRCARLEKIDDIGWLGAKNFRVSQLNQGLMEAVSVMPTVQSRLTRFLDLITTECSDIVSEMHRKDGMVRICCDAPWIEELEPLEAAEWVRIASVVEVVRSILGAAWCPVEITFHSRFQVSEEALREFDNTRFLFGQAHTSIVIPAALLAAQSAKASASGQAAFSSSASGVVPDCLVSQLRHLIQPYLGEMYPPIGLAAEITGTSVRTLQRRLGELGATYSDVVEAARFEVASDKLRSSDVRIIDIALAVGYEDQSNFSRAFRRVAGLTPCQYRHAVQTEQIAAE